MRKKQTKRRIGHVSQKRALQTTQVYLMHNVPCFWMNKFGISDHVSKRQKNVSETTVGTAFAIFAPELEFGYALEQWVHSLYSLQNVELKEGSGKREWFYVFNPVVSTLLACLHFAGVYTFDWPVYAFAVFSPFVWLDGLFWLLAFSLLRVLGYLLISLGAVYVFSHL